MNIVRLIGSVICMILAIIVGIISSVTNTGYKNSYKNKYKNKDKINDIPKYMKRGFVNKYYGRHESEYTSIDDAQFHYILNRMDNEMKGGKEKQKKTVSDKKKNSIHNWYNYKSWKELFNNSSEWNQYLNDRQKARTDFLFYWNDVFKVVMPLVQNEKYETIGVIRARPDGRSLYVHEMEKSLSNESNDSYAAGVSYNLVKKYSNIPSYFIFHTHPMGINGDPLPSDADIYSCLIDCYSDRFVGHVVIGEYGAIIYFINSDRLKQLESGGAVKYFTYCYDLVSAWNSFNNSSGPLNQRDRINFLEKWGFDMVIIPSPFYVADTYDKIFLPNVIHDKFTKTKYELLDKIKEFIKKLEIEEEKKIKNKK